VAAAFLARGAAAQIAVDLSKHQIEITAGFDGAELLLFGYDSKGAEVVVIVRGPPETVSVREKARTAGIWINQDEVTFERAPSFYFVATTEGLRGDGQLESILEGLGVGPRYLGLTAQDTDLSDERVEEFRSALINLREQDQLYAKEPGRVLMRDDRLFRTTVPFPSGTPIGDYTVTVYEVVDGWPLLGAETPLHVRKAGFGAFVSNTAHDHPALYGIVAILIALVAGWFGGWAFRKS
jgi:uncharacterized protein (TIGR02186 family)